MKKRKPPFIVIGIILVCLIAIGILLGLRSVLARFGASTTSKPINTLIWMLPGQPAYTETPTFTPIAITPNPSQPGTGSTTGNLPTTTTVPPAAATSSSLQPCNNVLYPLRTGQHWVYKATARGASYQVDMTVPSVANQQASVNLSNRATKLTSQVAVDCDNGAIRGFPSMVAGILFDQDIAGAMTAQYVSGVLAPSRSTFETNNWNMTWTGAYRLTGDGTVEFDGNRYALHLSQAPFQITCRTTGSGSAAFQPVTVTAGSYPSALKVICTMQTQATLKVNGFTVTGTVTGQTTQWFAPDVGLLKLQADSANIQYLIFTVPLNVSGGLELIQYQPAP